MALASAYGLQYNLPQDQMGQGPIRGGLRGQEQGIDFGQGDLMDADLYVKEGVTDEYYKKVAALKSFANEVSSRYGYDVTRPNYRDPESIRFHKAYLESLADLQATQNELKRLGQQENIAIQNPNVQMREFEDGSTRGVNVGETDLVRGLARAAAQVKSREGLEGFGETKKLLLDQLEEELAGSTDNRERYELQNTINQIKNINPDVGMSEAQEAQLAMQAQRDADTQAHRRQQLDIQRQRASGAGKPTQAQLDANNRIQTMLMLTDNQTLSSMGLERHDTMAGTYLSYKGGKERIKVDPENPQSFVNNVNRMLNEDKSTTSVGIDRLHDTGVDLNELGQVLSQRLQPRNDMTPQFLENLPNIIGSVKQNPKVGEDIASMLEKGVVIPPDLASRFGAKGKESEISSAKFTTPWFGGMRETPGFLKIKVGSKNVELDLNNPEDVNMLSQIIDYNANYLELDDISSLMPQITPPSSPDGTTIAPSASEGMSIDEF